MSNQDRTSGVIVISLIAVAIVAGAISSEFDVPLLMAVNMIPFLCIWVFVGVLMWYFGFLGHAWPLMAGALFWCFTPVLDYKAGVTGSDAPLMPYVEWYGHAGWQFIIFVGIIILGYVIKYWHDNR